MHEPRTRSIVFSIVSARWWSSVLLVFRWTKSRRNFYAQFEIQRFHTASGRTGSSQVPTELPLCARKRPSQNHRFPSPAASSGMSAPEQRKQRAAAKTSPGLGCRRETSTQCSQRSRRIKRLQRRLATAFLADKHPGGLTIYPRLVAATQRSRA